MFGSPRFQAPINQKSLNTLDFYGLLGVFMRNLPQLAIQAYAASSNMNTITLLSIVASVCMIVFGAVRRFMVILLQKMAQRRKGPLDNRIPDLELETKN